MRVNPLELVRLLPLCLWLALRREERPPQPRKYTANPDAYEHYVRGRYLVTKRTREAMDEAVRCFERAISFDDRFALAHAGLGEAWVHLGIRAAVTQSYRPHDAMPRARAAAQQALALDGAALFDPGGRGRPFKEWVAVPHTHADHWPALADQALR